MCGCSARASAVEMFASELSRGIGADCGELGGTRLEHLPASNLMQSRLLPIVVSLVALPFVAACQSGLSNGPLDGRVYEVKLAGGGQAPQVDALIFDGGQFESTACRAHGFRLAPYSSSINGNATTFEAVAKSTDAGANSWSGSIHGDAVQGTLKWTDAK